MVKVYSIFALPNFAVLYVEIQFYFCVAIFEDFVCWKSFCGLPMLALFYVKNLFVPCQCWPFCMLNSVYADQFWPLCILKLYIRLQMLPVCLLKFSLYLPMLALLYVEIVFMRCPCWPFCMLKFSWCVDNVSHFVCWNSIFAGPMLASIFVKILFVRCPCWPFYMLNFYLWMENISNFVWWSSFCSFPSSGVFYVEIQFYLCVAFVGDFVCWYFCGLPMLPILFVKILIMHC